MNVVFDTSVLVAAARSRRGASHALLSLLPDLKFRPAVSVPLFVEYRTVLMRPENLLGRAPSQVEEFLDFFLSISHIQEIFFLWRPILPDPADEMILELAVAADCRYIVTHNVRDFHEVEKWNIRVVRPGELLNNIDKEP